MLNFLKSLNNPAVQGVVAVSDSSQLETIRKHVLVTFHAIDPGGFQAN